MGVLRRGTGGSCPLHAQNLDCFDKVIIQLCVLTGNTKHNENIVAHLYINSRPAHQSVSVVSVAAATCSAILPLLLTPSVVMLYFQENQRNSTNLTNL